MSKATIIVLSLVGVVVVGAGAWFLLRNRNTNPPATGTSPAPAPKGTTSSGLTGTLNNLLGVASKGLDLYNNWNSGGKKAM